MLLNLCVLGYIILKPTLCKYFETGSGIPAQSCEMMIQTMSQNSTIKMWGASGGKITWMVDKPAVKPWPLSTTGLQCNRHCLWHLHRIHYVTGLVIKQLCAYETIYQRLSASSS